MLIAGPVVLVAVIVAAAFASSGGSGGSRAATGTAADPAFEKLPTRNSRAKVTEPVAGETAQSAGLPTEAIDEPAVGGASAPLSRSAKRRDTGPSDDASISAAEVLKGGIAAPGRPLVSSAMGSRSGRASISPIPRAAKHNPVGSAIVVRPGTLSASGRPPE